MKQTFLDFEQPIAELQQKIDELRFVHEDSAVDISDEIARLTKKSQQLTKEIYAKLTAWQIAQVARHPQRPYTLDYIGGMFSDFRELHGDRTYADDPAIVGGLARFNGKPCMVIGHQKGRDTKEKIHRNFGMPRPEGYRKALRLMKLAEKFGLPLFTFVDTPGAYPGIGAEERGQSEAIGRNLYEMAGLRVPIIVTVIGEGGSGGALAIAVGDVTLMLQYATYSVISPEGCASILWKSAEHAPEAAETLGITAPRLKQLGLIDKVVNEPLGGAHRDHAAMMVTLKKALTEALRQLQELPLDTLLERARTRSSPTASSRRSRRLTPPRLARRPGRRSPMRSTTPPSRPGRRRGVACRARAGAVAPLAVALLGGRDSVALSTRSRRRARARHRLRPFTSITDFRPTPTRGRRSAGTLCARAASRSSCSASRCRARRDRVSRRGARARATRRWPRRARGRRAVVAARAPSRRPGRNAAAAVAARRRSARSRRDARGARRPARHPLVPAAARRRARRHRGLRRRARASHGRRRMNADARYARNALRHNVCRRSRVAPAIRRRSRARPRTQAEAARAADDLAAAGRGRHDGHRPSVRWRAPRSPRCPHRARNLLRWFLRATACRRRPARVSRRCSRSSPSRGPMRACGSRMPAWRSASIAAASSCTRRLRPPIDGPGTARARWRCRTAAVPRETHGAGTRSTTICRGIVRRPLARAAANGYSSRPDRPRRALKSFLRESGVAPWERAALPLCYCGDDLAAVPGLGVDVAFRADPGRAGGRRWCRTPA